VVPKDDEEGMATDLGIPTPIFEIQVTQVDKMDPLREEHDVRQVG